MLKSISKRFAVAVVSAITVGTATQAHAFTCNPMILHSVSVDSWGWVSISGIGGDVAFSRAKICNLTHQSGPAESPISPQACSGMLSTAMAAYLSGRKVRTWMRQGTCRPSEEANLASDAGFYLLEIGNE